MINGIVTLSAVAESPNAQCERIVSVIVQLLSTRSFLDNARRLFYAKSYLKFGLCDSTSLPITATVKIEIMTLAYATPSSPYNLFQILLSDGQVMFLLILLFTLHILMSDILPLALCFSLTNAACYHMFSQSIPLDCFYPISSSSDYQSHWSQKSIISVPRGLLVCQ
jgi:hypothetical protein